MLVTLSSFQYTLTGPNSDLNSGHFKLVVASELNRICLNMNIFFTFSLHFELISQSLFIIRISFCIVLCMIQRTGLASPSLFFHLGARIFVYLLTPVEANNMAST